MGSVKTQIAGLHPQSRDSVVCRGAQLCISDKLPGDAEDAGPGVTTCGAPSWVILKTVLRHPHCSSDPIGARPKVLKGDKHGAKSLELLSDSTSIQARIHTLSSLDGCPQAFVLSQVF